ncbi:MAG: hypothetical protein AB1547_08030 [Thermodesulfobacteriota bacterium]
MAWYVAVVCVLSALDGLQQNSGIGPLADTCDSVHHFRMARSILEGQRLGPYDGMTLIRLSVYSAFVA